MLRLAGYRCSHQGVVLKEHPQKVYQFFLFLTPEFHPAWRWSSLPEVTSLWSSDSHQFVVCFFFCFFLSLQTAASGCNLTYSVSRWRPCASDSCRDLNSDAFEIRFRVSLFVCWTATWPRKGGRMQLESQQLWNSWWRLTVTCCSCQHYQEA